MARDPDRIVWAVEQLAAKTNDNIVEIGCGTGCAAALLSSRCARATITAVDRSALQVARARLRCRDSIAEGRVRIETMTLDEAAAALGHHFSKALAINVNAFWTEPATSLGSLRALLRPRGRVFLAYELPSASTLAKRAGSVVSALEASGFTVDDVRTPRGALPRLFGVMAHRLPLRQS